MHFDTVVPLMKGIMTPASWFTTLFYKPWYILHAMYNVIPWFIKNRQGVCRPRIFSWFKALRTSPPPYPTDSLKVGVAGFCWGGKFAFLLCADTPSSRVHRHESQVTASMLEPLIDCGFTAHPSMVNVPEDVEAVSLPLSVVVGNEDMAMKSADIKLMQEILTVKKKGDHEVNIIPGAKHGFAVREDPKDRFQGQCADKAEVQAIEWFTRWFA
jgi:dienelactone hydrolase